MKYVTAIFLLIFGISGAYAQNGDDREPPLESVYAEAFGVAGEGHSVSYDVRYPSRLGFRLGTTVDPDRPQSVASYRLFGMGHVFLGSGWIAPEVGAGPLLQVVEGAVRAEAAGYAGVRLQPIIGSWLLRAGYSPKYGIDGFAGHFGVSIGFGL